MSAMTFNEIWERAYGYAWGLLDSTGKATLRNMLVELKDAHEKEVATARDAFPLEVQVHDDEQRKAARMLRDWDPGEAWRHNPGQHDIHIRMLYQVLGLGGGLGMDGTEAAVAVRDRLVELLEA